MAYTYVAKPTSSTYSLQNFEGTQIYDDVNLTYDSATTFYDSFNPNSYGLVSKPTSSVYTYVAKPT
jgi:hypothetical protein